MIELALNKATGMFPTKRQKLVRYYARLPEPERLMLHAEQSELIRKHRKNWKHGRELLPYCMLIQALDERYRLEYATRLKTVALEDLVKAEEIRVNRVKTGRTKTRRGAKRAVISPHLRLIKKLREQYGLSWREIAAYLKKHYMIKVAHSYLCTVYNKHAFALETPLGRNPALLGDEEDSAVADDGGAGNGG